MKPFSLVQLVDAIAAGDITPEKSIRETAERIAALDGRVGAFVRLAPPETVAAARAASGPLCGVPLGVKDNFDTFDMATEHGSPISAGNRPVADASLVAMARGRGAFIAGKTVSTEFAHMQPAGTRNPRGLDHTPGGSSSGSAAAVAAGMVAGAFGSQTGGSVIRPAAFCGVAGYKPTFQMLPTVGMKAFSWSLDTAGLFAAGVADVALLAALLTGRDLAIDNQSRATVRIGLYRSGEDHRLTPDMVSAWDRAASLLAADGAQLVDILEPPALAEARAMQGRIQNFEAAMALKHEWRIKPERLSPGLRAALEAGAATSPVDYDQASRLARVGRRAATALFDTVDALLVPSTLGAAPASLASTGDPVMNKLWTLTGNPCVNVPGLDDHSGMPLGLTVLTRFGRDREALAIAARLEGLIAAGR